MAEPIENGTLTVGGDVEMKEEMHAEAPLSSIQQAADLTDPQPPPQAVSSINPDHLSIIQQAEPSIAATPTSAGNTRPGPVPPQLSARPEKPVAHGGPTRQYLNQHVTPHLLEGMKHLAAYEPDKPLLWLADFLRDRSKEVEG